MYAQPVFPTNWQSCEILLSLVGGSGDKQLPGAPSCLAGTTVGSTGTGARTRSCKTWLFRFLALHLETADRSWSEVDVNKKSSQAQVGLRSA